MRHQARPSHVTARGIAGAAVLVLLPVVLHAQGRGAAGRGAGAPVATARAAAPIDLTGYWVAEVTEDWRWRMVTPAKGDYQSIPVTAAAVMVADAWDPAKDEAAGEQCRSYGAPALMRAPTRLHITWNDDDTLKVESDYGIQTRLLHFGNWKSPAGPPTWQGDSLAHWDTPPVGRGANPASRAGSLVVSTSHIRPGYLRKNGVPYSADAVMTEYWDLVGEQHGEQRILLLVVVEDPQYLRVPWVVPVHFKKETDGAKWDPTPCSSTW
jgi:hypothetical protein